MEQNKPILPTFFLDLKEAFHDKGGKIDLLEERNAFALWQKASTGKKRSIVYAVKAGSFFRPRLDRLIYDFPEAPAGNDGSIYTVIDSAV